MQSLSCMVAFWLGQLSKQVKTQVCSLLCRTGFESAGHKRHNYQVTGLWGGEGHCAGKKMPYTWLRGERMEEGTGMNIRCKIVVWTFIKDPSGFYIEEGYPQHLVFQILFKSKRPQGAFCEDLNRFSVRCALRIRLGEGCAGNLVFLILCFCILTVDKAERPTQSKSRLARKQNSNF